MNEEAHSPGNFSNLRWPIIGFVVVAVLLGLKMILVNKSGEVPVVAPAPVAYSKPGPIVSGNVTIGAGEFLSKQIILNRRAKLSGELISPLPFKVLLVPEEEGGNCEDFVRVEVGLPQ